jgi:hypothetical protein
VPAGTLIAAVAIAALASQLRRTLGASTLALDPDIGIRPSVHRACHHFVPFIPQSFSSAIKGEKDHFTLRIQLYARGIALSRAPILCTIRRRHLSRTNGLLGLQSWTDHASVNDRL